MFIRPKNFLTQSRLGRLEHILFLKNVINRKANSISVPHLMESRVGGWLTDRDYYSLLSKVERLVGNMIKLSKFALYVRKSFRP
jgi:hypothetical protein